MTAARAERGCVACVSGWERLFRSLHLLIKRRGCTGSARGTSDRVQRDGDRGRAWISAIRRLSCAAKLGGKSVAKSSASAQARSLFTTLPNPKTTTR